MKKNINFFKISILLMIFVYFWFSVGCTQNENNIELFLKYVYSFESQSNSEFFEEFYSAEGVEEISKLLDEKYEYMDNLCTQKCTDRLRNNRDPISIWKFLYDNSLDMNVKDINIKKVGDSSYDFSVDVDISKDNETIYSSVQKGQIILDEQEKIDNVFFQNLNKIFEINR